MYDVHLKLIGKRVVDFQLNFFATCYRWCAASEYRLKIGDLSNAISFTQKFQVHFFLRKLGKMIFGTI